MVGYGDEELQFSTDTKDQGPSVCGKEESVQDCALKAVG